ACLLFHNRSTVRPAHLFFFSSRRRHTRSKRDWSSDVCSSDLLLLYSLPAGTLWDDFSLPERLEAGPLGAGPVYYDRFRYYCFPLSDTDGTTRAGLCLCGVVFCFFHLDWHGRHWAHRISYRIVDVQHGGSLWHPRTTHLRLP